MSEKNDSYCLNFKSEEQEILQECGENALKDLFPEEIIKEK